LADLDSSDATVEALLTWESENPQHKHGRHEYSMADFGLTDAEISEAFTTYLARFGR
jgi:hypothetical protein